MADNRVFIAACDEYEEIKVGAAVGRCLSYFGGAQALVRPGAHVVIKPNLLMPSRPDEARTTHPAVVLALAREFLSAGAQVSVAESCGGVYNVPMLKMLYRSCGLEAALKDSGVKLNYDTASRQTQISSEAKIRSVPVITPVLEADFVVSLGKVKTHGLTAFTGAVKNLFGTVPGLKKAALHSALPQADDFCGMIVDVCEAVGPGLSLLDGVIGMEGDGPAGGSPRSLGALIASLNPHAADLAAAGLIGLDPESVPTLRIAAKRGLVPNSLRELTLAGDDYKALRTRFRPAGTTKAGKRGRWVPGPLRPIYKKLFMPYPLIKKEECVGCGACERICPRHIITVKNHKAQIDYKDCIKCYCCHEMCSYKAIDFTRRPEKSRAG